jgi:hypothetical protein
MLLDLLEKAGHITNVVAGFSLLTGGLAAVLPCLHHAVMHAWDGHGGRDTGFVSFVV